MPRSSMMIAAAIGLSLCIPASGSSAAFSKSRTFDEKGKEIQTTIEFDGQSRSLTVRPRKGSSVVIPYDKVEKLSYDLASRRRIKEGAIVMLASLGAGGIVMLTKSKKHWLYVDYKDAEGKAQTLTLQLDKSEYRNVLAVAKTQCGKEIVDLSAQKQQGK